ncbi:MAG: DUF1549 domain-containing protein, partial [Planctomycetaceae bacterium]
ATSFDGAPAPNSSDAAFFRRIHLDLAGHIPGPDETRRFLSDTSSDKRQATVDRLLNSPAYPARMANLFHVMLMERRGDNAEWDTFLRTCFEQNKPWDQIVREILKPDDGDETRRGAAYFYTRRLEKVGQQTTDYPGLTRDVGRLFLGVDLQCAECHDHLFIDDYKQREFQGLLAVYRNISIRAGKFPAINEKSMTARLEFISVFEPAPGSTGPRVPFGREFEIPDPPREDPDGKKKKPDPNEPATFSALSLIAGELPSSDNPLFRQNIANRLWFSMMGRGLVEPLDQFHSANQATHPKLLELLASELAAHKYDLKWMLRELVLTETWQRSSRMLSGKGPLPRDSYRLGSQRRLTAEQLFQSTLQATGNLARLTPEAGAQPDEKFQAFKSSFVAAYSAEPKEPALGYAPAVKQALFVLNDSQMLDLLKPQAHNLTDRVNELPDDRIADELYLSIFCRLPDPEERQMIEEYLQNNADTRGRALNQLTWAMLTSMEFAVNH